MNTEQVTSTEFEDAQPQQTVNVKSKSNTPSDPTNTPAKDGSKFNSNFYARTRTTLYMIGAFILILAAGHFYCLLLILLINFLIFNELNSIKRNEQKQVNIPMTKFINWYIFFLVNYYSLGNFIGNKIPILGSRFQIIGELIQYHSFICFCMMIAGFLAFVLSLKQGYLKYQFRLFGWIVVATLLVSMQGWLMVHNLYEGMIWFVIPAFLIVCNDVFAYIVGYFFGKHQLIALSPKKTWQGYIGGAVITFLFSLILASALQDVEGMICKVIEPTFMPFNYPSCKSDLIQPMTGFLAQIVPFEISRIQGHVLILSLFASIIGPFGGFFASGLKRAIKIKDFANLIPGHGGVSDRMDCQIIMGAFTYFYLSAFLRGYAASGLAFWVTLLSPADQLQLYELLQKKLIKEGLIKNI